MSRSREGATARYDPAVVTARNASQGTPASRVGVRVRVAGALTLLMIASVTTVGVSGAAAANAPSTRQQREQRYVDTAVLKAVNSAACAEVRVPTTITRPPPAALLSILGVLRQPATPGDQPPARILAHDAELYVNYVRLAQTASGRRWYVLVAGSNFRPPANVERCLAAQSADFRAELPSIPKALRAETSQMFETQQRAARGRYSQPVRPVGVSLLGVNSAGGGGGGGGGTATLIDNQGMWLSEGGGTGADPARTLFAGVVPDGVATVTLHYPAGKLGGFSRRTGPAITVTVPAVNNVVVVSVERAGNQATGAVTTTWRAANGTIIKTIHGAL